MSSRNIIQIPSESVLREQLARATAEVKKLELLIEVAKKLDEIYDGVSHHGLGGYAVDQKTCVAQKANRQGLPPDWTPAEDDLLHKLLASSRCYADAYRAFENHPANVNNRPAGGARQRHDKLQREAAKRGKRWLDA